MNTPALAQDQANNSSTAALPLWMAQRAFAALIEDRSADGTANLGAFRTAQLRSAARRTLSTLSADDHASLQRWLSLQLATGGLREADVARNPLARVDATLAANVAAAASRVRDELFAPRTRDGAAAA